LAEQKTRAADCNCPRAAARCAALIDMIKIVEPSRHFRQTEKCPVQRRHQSALPNGRTTPTVYYVNNKKSDEFHEMFSGLQKIRHLAPQPRLR
jgi:hypothetical protein